MDKHVIANELVPVYETTQGERLVDARELHLFLRVGRDFTNWIKDRIEKYGFVECEDFSPILAKTDFGRPRTDYLLQLDMAKELCMVENNEMGSRARKYFIEVEKRFRGSAINVSKLSPELQMFHRIFESVAKQQLEIDGVKRTVTEIQETFLKRDEDWRKSINSMLKGAAHRAGGDYSLMRTESYRILEERAGCDLSTRLQNLKHRLEESGATKSRIERTNRMDVVESDKRLKEIYITVVKELSIGTLRIYP